MIDKNHIKEIHRASGNKFGGWKVNMLFEDSLKKLFSIEAITHIQREHPRDWMRIMDQFESAKKALKSAPLDIEMNEMMDLSKDCKKYLKKHYNRNSDPYQKGVKIKNKCLMVPVSFIKYLFKSITQDITDYIKNLLSELSSINLDAVVLVGGFANSEILQQEIKNCFGEISLFVPMVSPELCVVKGAVLFGWKREIIRSRISRYTYGISVLVEEKNGEYLDDRNKLVSEDRFEKFISIDQEVLIDESITKELTHPHLKDEELTRIQLYRTEERNPKRVDEKTMEVVAFFDIPNDVEKHGKPIVLEMYFGETDIRLYAQDITDGKTYEASFELGLEGRPDNAMKFRND